MRVASSAADLFADPRDACLFHRRFAYVCLTETVYATLAWGHIEESDARALHAVVEAEERAGLVPHKALIHFGHLRSAEPAAIARVAAFLEEHRLPQSRMIVAEAAVRPARGPLAMMVAGFYDVVQAPFPAAVFADAGSALAWLGCGAQAGPWAAALEALHHRASGTPDLVADLRLWLAAASAHAPTLSSAAKQLGISARSLQRRLTVEGTTFRAELTAARVHRARAMLSADGAVSLKEVALEVGFSSSQAFGRAHRRLFGDAPGPRGGQREAHVSSARALPSRPR